MRVALHHFNSVKVEEQPRRNFEIRSPGATRKFMSTSFCNLSTASSAIAQGEREPHKCVTYLFPAILPGLVLCVHRHNCSQCAPAFKEVHSNGLIVYGLHPVAFRIPTSPLITSSIVHPSDPQVVQFPVPTTFPHPCQPTVQEFAPRPEGGLHSDEVQPPTRLFTSIVTPRIRFPFYCPCLLRRARPNGCSRTHREECALTFFRLS